MGQVIFIYLRCRIIILADMTERSSRLTTLCVLTFVASLLHAIASGGAAAYWFHYLMSKGFMVFVGLALTVIGNLVCFVGAVRMFKRNNKGYVGYLFGSGFHLIGLLIVWLVLSPYAADYGKGGPMLMWNSGVMFLEFIAAIAWVYGYHSVSHEWEGSPEGEGPTNEEVDAIENQTESTQAI